MNFRTLKKRAVKQFKADGHGFITYRSGLSWDTMRYTTEQGLRNALNYAKTQTIVSSHLTPDNEIRKYPELYIATHNTSF